MNEHAIETDALRAALDAYRELHAAACDDYWSENECACGGRQKLAAAEAALERLER